MSEYLSKEEIKQWRSSLEKITLEEFAARLGKKVEEKKSTNDLIDIVLHGNPVVSEEPEKISKAERLTAIAEKAYEKEKEIYSSPFSAKNLKTETSISQKSENSDKTSDKKHKVSGATKSQMNIANNQLKNAAKDTNEKKESKNISVHLEQAKKIIENTNTSDELRNEVRLTFKKALTQREQVVMDYFTSHRREIVYAKDLANLLGVPRDYVYKYIKNIREKVETSDILKNADKGGFILDL